MDLGAVRDQLRARLAIVAGLTAYDTVPSAPSVPCAVMHPGVINFHPVFGAGTTVGFNIQILVQLSDFRSAQDALDAYVSTGTNQSIVDALEDDACTITVTSADGYGMVAISDTSYAAVTFHVEVLV